MGGNGKPKAFGKQKAFGYKRKSTEGEDRQILSLDDQDAWIRNECSRLGYSLAGIFEDSKSAKSPNSRPGFSAMMLGLSRGEADVVVTWKLDRLARNPVDAGAVNWALQRGEIGGIATSDRVFSPSDNVMLMMIEFSMANQYVRDLSKNVRRGMDFKTGRGGWCHKAPLGYKNVREGKVAWVEIDEDSAPFVRMGYGLWIGGKTIYQVSEEAWRAGLRSRRGFRVHASSWRKILSDPFYKGMVRRKGELFAGSHKAIIGTEEWDAASARFGKPSRPTKAPRAFSGMFVCGECGCAVTAEEQKGRTYYRCTKKHGRCGQSYVREDRMADLLAAELDKRSIRPEIVPEIKKTVVEMLSEAGETGAARRRWIESRIKAEESKIDRLRVLLVEGSIDADDYKKSKSESMESICKLNSELVKAKKKTDVRLERILGWLELSSSLGKWAKSLSLPKLALFAKTVGSNWMLIDGKPLMQDENPIMRSLKSAEKTVWSGRRCAGRTDFAGLSEGLNDRRSTRVYTTVFDGATPDLYDAIGFMQRMADDFAVPA